MLRLVMVCLLLYSPSLLANSQQIWRCNAYDKHNRAYSATAKLMQDAIHKAYKACRNSSRVRSSCRTSPNYCTSDNIQGYRQSTPSLPSHKPSAQTPMMSNLTS